MTINFTPPGIIPNDPTYYSPKPILGPNGWDMIASGIYKEFIYHYGLQSIFIFIITIAALHIFSLICEQYFRLRRLYPEKNRIETLKRLFVLIRDGE